MGHGSWVLVGACSVLLAAGGAGTAADEAAKTDAEMEDFLLRAKISSVETLSVGVTHSKRATLTLEGRSHDAHIQTVDVFKNKARVGRQTVLNFHDSYRYNIAAYRLDRLLDLRMVPVSVERTFERKKAAFTWWVDDVMMMERDRLAGGLKAPDPRSWFEQVFRRRIFDQLVANVDLNQTNVLITHDWKVWLIDFTRAFRRDEKLHSPGGMVKIEKPFLERLRGLSRERLESRLGDCLTTRELLPLLARRDAIVEYFDRQIERRGAAAVIYEPPENTTDSRPDPSAGE